MNQTSPEPAPRQDLPEELTPEEIQDAFRRYHLIIAGFVLLMSFFAASFIATAPDLWQRLATGRSTAEQFPSFPKTNDFTFSAAEGVTAPNPSWLYDLTSYFVFQAGDVPFVVTKVILVVLTTLVLLSIRRSGPTLGWHALCVALALVTMASRLDVGPTIVSYLFVALLLWVWNKASTSRNSRWMYASIPVLILWANVDILFPLGGALVLAFWVGETLDRLFNPSGASSSRSEVKSSALPFAIAAVVGVLAGFISPFGYLNFIYPYTTIPILHKLPILDTDGEGWNYLLSSLRENRWTIPLVVWICLVILALFSFLLNASRFRFVSILLVVVAIAVATFERWIGVSGIILAVVTSLNAQEFYVARFGTSVRTSFSALVVSQLGVIGIILVVFAGMLGMLTGRIQGHVAQFGFTIDRSLFPERTAEWLASSGLEQSSFTISPAQRVAGYLIWADPKRKSFIDTRWTDGAGGWLEHDRARFSVMGLDPKRVDPNAWKEIFKKQNVSNIIVDLRDESELMRTVRQQLAQRSDIAPIHVDDQCVVYGWLTDSISDYAKIKSHRLQTNAIAFREKRDPSPPTDRPVTPPGIIDDIWPIRWAQRPDGLFRGTFFSGGGYWLGQPGSSTLATAYLREAVSNAPDSPDANLRLGVAFIGVCQQELMALASQRKRPTVGPTLPKDAAPAASPQDPAQTSSSNEAASSTNLVPSDTILTRHHQTMAALQAALTAGADNFGIHKAISDFAQMNGFVDLWLQQLEEQRRFAQDPKQRGVIDAELEYVRAEVKQRKEQYKLAIQNRSKELADQSKKIDEELAKLAEKIKGAKEAERPQLEQQQEFFRRQADAFRQMSTIDRPYENAQIAFGLNLPLLAVIEIEKVPIQSPEASASAEFAARLYLRIGMPDKAMGRLNLLKTAEASNKLPPGVYQWLLAQVQITSGQFEAARDSLEQAIAAVRGNAVITSLNNVEARIRAGLMVMRSGSPVVNEARGIITERSFEASYLYDLAMVHLALAEPARAAEDFLAINKLVPEFQLRPVMEFYYQQIAEKSLPVVPVPSTEDEIALRFPPKATDTAPSADKSNTPNQETPKPATPAETPVGSPEPSKPAEKPSTEEKK
ncbi:hypothetical protein K2Y11_18165 [bacterium]|nr:hypothetical protein [bacterium]